MEMIQKGHPISLRRQCRLLAVHRSRVYYQKKERATDTELANEMLEIYRQNPMYGYRRLRACLRRRGYRVNGKRVLGLMKEMGIRGIYPGPRTTCVDRKAYKHPYALAEMVINKPHQAWQIDLTYLRTDHGFVYLTALIDVCSRYVVGWCLSNSLETSACLRCLEYSIDMHGVPFMINSDQGSQFTSHDWVNALTGHGIVISMSGSGRSNDNAHIERLWRTLKYEGLYIQGCRTVAELKKTLPKFMAWYNNHRPHQALAYRTPAEALKIQPDVYVDNLLHKLPHISTGSTTTTKESMENSLIL